MAAPKNGARYPTGPRVMPLSEQVARWMGGFALLGVGFGILAGVAYLVFRLFAWVVA